MDARGRLDPQPLMADGRRMLTLVEVAHRLETTVEIVRKLIKIGSLHAVKLSPRNTRIPEHRLVAFMDQ